MEIEKKYLVKVMPELDNYQHHEIEQGYLCRTPVLRIRKKDKKYIFTYKSKKEISGGAIVCDEVERELTKAAYEQLRGKVDGYLIKKTRYLIPLDGKLTVELDVFHDRLKGLVFMEVEFPDVMEASAFIPPDWFGADVTEDKRYRNGYLSTLKKYENFD